MRTSGTPTPSSSSVPLAIHVLHGVGRERLELRGQPRLRFGHQGGDRLGVLRGALRDRLLTDADGVAVDADLHALLDGGEDLGADVVQQHDAVRDEQIRAEVRVTPGDARLRVDDGGDLGRHERLGRDPVEVDMVDHRDVAGVEPPHESLGSAVQPRHPADAGQGVGARGAALRAS